MASALDLGPPIAFPAIEEGMPVHDAAGERVGVVDEVLIDGDIWEGIVVHMGAVPARHVFVGAEEIRELRARGLVLALTKEQLVELDELSRGGQDEERLEHPAHRLLRRAWDRVAGRR